MDPDDYLLDDGARNAPVRVRRPFWTVPRMAQAQQAPVVVQYPSPHTYPMQPLPGYAAQPQVVVRQKRILDMPAGEVLALAAQAFAALQPLPNAPSAIGKADDDAANLVTYQAALANHAKRDEQLRTLGALLSTLLG